MLSKAISVFAILVLAFFVMRHPDALVAMAQAVIDAAVRAADALAELKPSGASKT